MPTVADILADLPLPYAECNDLAVVFPSALVQPLVNAQAWYGDGRFQALPLPLTDGRWMLPGSLLSEIPAGLYGAGFSRLNFENFAYCEVVPFGDVESLIYTDEDGTPPSLPEPAPTPEPAT